VSARARVFEYEVTVDRDWAAHSSQGGSAIPSEEAEWTPEHLLLAGLARCSLTSFRYHARRAGLDPVTTASVHGRVTRREQDGRFALVEANVAVDVVLEVPPPHADLRALIAKGERDCFVGASLATKPSYRWTVNGEEIS